MTAVPPHTFDALSLDAGGVFVLPHHPTVLEALGGLGLSVDPELLWDAHYHGMFAIDHHQSDPETWGDYVPAFCHHLGLRDDDHRHAVGAIGELYGPARFFATPIAESAEDLRALHSAGVPMVVLSNADGTIEEVLLTAQVCQVGAGDFVPMKAIIDSGIVGVDKPHPRIFELAVAELGVAADRVLHVGDSITFDVDGARDAGLQSAHFDPRHLCDRSDHRHVHRLVDVLPQWSGL